VSASFGYGSETFGDVSKASGYGSESVGYGSETFGDISKSVGDVSESVGDVSETFGDVSKTRVFTSAKHRLIHRGCDEIVMNGVILPSMSVNRGKTLPL
jgi:hypothetical protein